MVDDYFAVATGDRRAPNNFDGDKVGRVCFISMIQGFIVLLHFWLRLRCSVLPDSWRIQGKSSSVVIEVVLRSEHRLTPDLQKADEIRTTARWHYWRG